MNTTLLGVTPRPDDDGLDGLGWVGDGPWSTMMWLFLAAGAVLMIGRYLAVSRSSGRGGGKTSAPFDLKTTKFEQLSVTKISEAKHGPVHLECTIASSVHKLGGEPGNECVWTNRVGAPTDAAVGSSLIVVEDSSGQAGIESLEHARVIAPALEHTNGTKTRSLYIGDKVQVLGQFRQESYAQGSPSSAGGEDGEGPQSTSVYGMLGGSTPVQFRVLQRYDGHTTESGTTD